MITRILSLMRLLFIEQRRSIGIAAGAVFGALTVIYLLSLLGGTDNFHAFFPLVLVVGGTIVTSLAFIDLHLPHKSQAYLLLPVSAVERVIERIITTNILFVLAVSLAYGLFSLIAAGLGELILGRSFELYFPFSGEGLAAIKRYMLLHAVILFGAVYFRRKNLLKTLLSLAILGLTLGFFTAILSWISFGSVKELAESGFFSGMAFSGTGLTGQMTRMANLFSSLARVLRFFFIYALTPILWVLTWLRLRETEVVHGV